MSYRPPRFGRLVLIFLCGASCAQAATYQVGPSRAYHNVGSLPNLSRIQFLSANANGASIIALNNVFFGSGTIAGLAGAGIDGTNNWSQSSANDPPSFTSTVTGAEPGFIDR